MLDAGVLVRQVADSLNDREHERWSKSDLADYLTSALRQLVMVRPQTTRETAVVSLTGNVLQSIPDDGLRFIELGANVTRQGHWSSTISRADFDVLDRFDPDWRAKEPADKVAHYAVDDRRPTEFYVYPPVETGTRVELVYAKAPERVSAPDGDDWPEIDIPPHYESPLRHWMMHRAYANETSPQSQNLSQTHFQAFYQTLGEKVPGDARIDPRRRQSQSMPQEEGD